MSNVTICATCFSRYRLSDYGGSCPVCQVRYAKEWGLQGARPLRQRDPLGSQPVLDRQRLSLWDLMHVKRDVGNPPRDNDDGG